jgi:cellobiose phosphorylase
MCRICSRARCAGAHEPIDAPDRERRLARGGVRPARRPGFAGVAAAAGERRAPCCTAIADSLAEQINRARDNKPGVRAPRPAPAGARAEVPLPRPEMEFFNGLGGFTNDGREYLTILGGGGPHTGALVNVIANPSFGFQVSTDGSGFTWSLNSQQNQLTPWSNDPVGDAPGEVIYVRDEETGEVWGPTALPIREKNASIPWHGQGYSRFEHTRTAFRSNFCNMCRPTIRSRFRG